MVIHGGIDGYSGLIVFMKAADNNRARTVYEAFMPATECYGVPSRVRCDHGVENLDVAAFMIMYRGENRGSCITGKSVHNQRIERLWRDLFQGCTSTYHALFCYLESESLLDPDNPLHLWCLHYVFMPRLRRDLEKFREGWNQHRLRSVRGKSPILLYVSGILENRNRGQRGVDDLFYEPSTGDDVDTEDYGVDWDEPVPEDENGDSLISSLDCPITDVQLSDLQRQVSPLGESADQFGIDLYLQAVEFCTDVKP